MLTNSEKGRKGGQSKSERKRAASRANLHKARIKRYPGREIAAQLTENARLEHESDLALVDQINKELGFEPGKKRALYNVAFEPGDLDG